MDNKTSNRCTYSFSDLDLSFFRSKPNIAGLVGILVFYGVVFGVGIIATLISKRRNRKKQDHVSEKEDVMLAGRNIGIGVGIFTLTATWVGGGYINGTAEYVFNPEYGLVWCQAPIFYSLSLIINGIFFARTMRDAGYITMLDVFQQRFGRVLAAFLFIPALLGDIFWSGTILAALGASLSVIVGLSHVWSIVISAGVSVLYTLIGGLYSVAYTDVIQLVCMIVGLWLTIPFAMTHDAVDSISSTASKWLGSPIRGPWLGYYIDSALLLLLGGIPWQVYYQRVFAQKSGKRAMILSIVAGVCVLIMAIPAVLIGAIAASTDWNATGYREFGHIPVPPCDYPLALPMVMRFLTPTSVGVIGLGAVSAAVMSSTDSSVLSSGTLFANNVYAPIRDAIGRRMGAKEASDREVIWVMRIAVVFVGGAATLTAITATSIYGLFVVCSDLLYVVVFPQLVCAVHIPHTNTYGSLAGLIVSTVLRFLGGEPYLNFDPVIKYPWFDEATQTQMFPFKTLIVIIVLVVIVVVSVIATWCSGWSSSCVAADRKLFAVWSPEAVADDIELKVNGSTQHGLFNVGYVGETEDGVKGVKYNKTA